jgi:hypothetical protein
VYGYAEDFRIARRMFEEAARAKNADDGRVIWRAGTRFMRRGLETLRGVEGGNGAALPAAGRSGGSRAAGCV